jgi:AraC-like DNA-binding protein
LFKVAGADGIFGVHEQLLPLAGDWAVAVSPGEPHHYPKAPDHGCAVILALYIEPLWLAARLGDFSGLPCFPSNKVRIDAQLRKLVNMLSAEMIYGTGDDEVFVEELVLALATQIGQADVTEAGGLFALQASCSPVDYRIRRSIEYMRAQLSEHLDLGAVAREAGLSRQHFFDLFRRGTHLTPAVYWNVLRMERAVDSLGTGRRPIQDIALDLGFSAQGNFTRFFKEHQGVTPRDYRNALVNLNSRYGPARRPTAEALTAV